MQSVPFRKRVLAAALLAIGVAAVGCGKREGLSVQAAGGPPPAMAVTIKVARAAPVDESSEYVATLKSRNSTTINPQVEGQVTHIYVKSGDKVAAGAPLMQIDPLKQQATVGSQEATRAAKLAGLRYAEQQLQRSKNLYAAGVISKQTLDQDQSAYDAASAELKALEAQVSEQRVQLRYYLVSAPADGTVGDIPVHVGDRVSLLTALTTLDMPGNFEAYIDVPVERAANLALGKTVRIVDAKGMVVLNSRISFISPQINEATQSVLVKARISGSKVVLRTEQFARARIIWGTRNAVTVPVLAVSRINGQFFAFVAEGGDAKPLIARQRQLKVGEILGNDYVVLEGIKEGDRIIVSGTQFIADGLPVTPQS